MFFFFLVGFEILVDGLLLIENFFFFMTVTSFYVAVATSLLTSKSSIAIVYH